MGPTWISGNNVTENLRCYSVGITINFDTMRNLLPFVQFKKHEKHPWRGDTFSKVADWILYGYWK